MCEYNREIDEIQDRFREMSDGEGSPETDIAIDCLPSLSDAIAMFSAMLIVEVLTEAFPHGFDKYRQVYRKVNAILETHDRAKYTMLAAKGSCRRWT